MTPVTDPREAARSFASHVNELLGGRLVSAYIYGSVTLGDYRDGWSDIDVICFADTPPTPTEAESLVMLRQTLVETENSPIYRKIEGAVVCLDEFAKGSYSRLVYYGTSGQRVTDRYVFDAFAMYELIKYGELILGGDVRMSFALPTYAELAAGVAEHYATVRQYARETNESLYSCGWLLDIARCIYTLRYGGVIAKTRAGEWALDEGLCPCPDELRRALAVRKAPLEYIGLPETGRWLCSLGEYIQSFADALESELSRAGA